MLTEYSPKPFTCLVTLNPNRLELDSGVVILDEDAEAQEALHVPMVALWEATGRGTMLCPWVINAALY